MCEGAKLFISCWLERRETKNLRTKCSLQSHLPPRSPCLPKFSPPGKSPLSYESVNGFIYWWDQRPHDPVTFQWLHVSCERTFQIQIITVIFPSSWQDTARKEQYHWAAWCTWGLSQRGSGQGRWPDGSSDGDTFQVIRRQQQWVLLETGGAGAPGGHLGLLWGTWLERPAMISMRKVENQVLGRVWLWAFKMFF